MPARTSSSRRGPHPAAPQVLNVQIGEHEPDGNRPRRARRGAFGFTTAETQAALVMLSHPAGAVVEVTGSLKAGFRGLRARGLIDLPADATSSRDAAAASDGVVHAQWVDAAALAAAARRTTMPFNLALRTQLMLTHAAEVLDGGRDTYTATGLALVLAHRYQFTGVHALTIAPTPTSTTGAATADPYAAPYGYEVVEHRHHHRDRVRVLPSVAFNRSRLPYGAPGLDTDKRRVLLPHDMEALALHAYYRHRATSVSGQGLATDQAPVRLDLDYLTEHDGRDSQQAGASSWMPALLADALNHLGTHEADLPTASDFHAWAQERLRYPLRCGDYTHIRQINPTTATVHTPAEYAEQYAAEEMLTALRLPPGAATGCAAAEEFLPLPLDGAVWGSISDEIVLRWVVRAVQYLDAGLDLIEAADFLLFALPAEQASELVACRRRGDEAAVTEQLFTWVRALLNRGTIT